MDFDMTAVDRILNERVNEESNVASQYSQLIHYLKENVAKEMKSIIRESKGKDVADVLEEIERWLEEKTVYLNKILEDKKINDSKLSKILEDVEIKTASKPYKMIRQIQDAAAHFVAEYRAYVR